MPHASPTTDPRRRPRGTVILVELAHALTFIPLLLLGIFLLLLLPITAPLAAELERACARLAGAQAPSSRPPGQGTWSWLLARARQPGRWMRDLPLMFVGGALCAPGLLITVGGGALGAILCALPSRLSAQAPLKLHLFAWSANISSAGQGWWLVPLGAACLAAAGGLLYALGRLRARLAQALSDSSQDKRLATLTAEVGHLTAGRTTLVDAFDAERTRIERDLHDGAQQELVALTMGLGMARVRALADEDGPEAGREALLADLDAAQDRAEAALRSLRETVHGIRPAVLTERGLGAALRDLAGRAPLPTTMSITDAEEHLDSLTSPVATAVYFAVSEALTNAARHAGPGATATVQLDVGAQGLSAVVTDDGRGGADPSAAGSTGLAGMAQRLESVGGRLAIDSAPGAGTRLTITAPLTPPWAESAAPSAAAGPARRGGAG
ncbi:hypothetical protein AM609_06195 [Actinomyces sp. oral taxon 414]|uniref:sensor histidine kinase n=1 Tax=Actinomyces sp. oral taxon 414 TaxID=712122 RepID=UPI0006AE574B|nr:sensor histidine kinase [Actinomyces sp. oral taxon 414]ALC99175.1 hypothetical protein AM609_06195 [Actinomyces sp. oral taxon 414]